MTIHTISKRALMKMGGALIAAGPLAAAGSGADAQDLLSALLDQDKQLSRQLSALRSNLPKNVTYVQSNIAAAGGNSILAYRRDGAGRLTPLPGSPYSTAGTGFLYPSLIAPGPFSSDQQIVIDRLRGVLYTINGGSSTIAAMRIAADGGLAHLPGSPFPSGGINPSSIGLRLGSLVVTNTDSSTAAIAGPNPTVSLFSLDLDGTPNAIPGATTAIAAGSNPTQALTTNTGLFTFVCNIAGSNIQSYLAVAFGREGLVRLLDTQTPPQQAGATSAPTPLGLAASPNARVLYAGFATTEQLGVYRWDELGRLTFLRTAINSGKALCWMRMAADGRRLYTANTADNSMSVYDTTNPERPVEIQHLVLDNPRNRLLVQFEITPDGRFIYALDDGETRANAVAGISQVFSSQLRVVAIHPADGTLSEVPSALLTFDLPADTIPQGVAAL